MKQIQQKKPAAGGTKRKDSVTLGQEELIKKDRETLDRMFAEYIAWKFPLYEAGRNVVGFLKGMVSKDLTDSITDLLRGHSREMQCEIADSIRIYVLWQEIDLTGVQHVDDALERIFERYNDDINN
jgi:hypothetical protein